MAIFDLSSRQLQSHPALILGTLGLPPKQHATRESLALWQGFQKNSQSHSSDQYPRKQNSDNPFRCSFRYWLCQIKATNYKFGLNILPEQIELELILCH